MSEDMKCYGCAKPFSAGDRVLTWNLEVVKRGEKSGELGYYEDINYQDGAVDHSHWNARCVEQTFNPYENNFMWDSIIKEIEEEYYEELAYSHDDDCGPSNEDPPFCIHCKKETVWVKFYRDMTVYFCGPCQRFWDHEEYEVRQVAEDVYARTPGQD